MYDEGADSERELRDDEDVLPRQQVFRRICAWCRRVAYASDWGTERRAAHDRPDTHGICPDCMTQFE